MNTRAKKQLTVLIMVAMLLVLLIVASIFLMPNGTVTKTITKPGTQNMNSSAEEKLPVNKFDFVGRIFDADMNPIAGAEFVISCGPTTFKTDENGFFRLNGLPVGIYKLYAIVNGEQVGETEIQLSNDGCFTVGYVFYENGTVVTMMFNGETFVGIEIKNDSGEPEQTPENIGNDDGNDSSTGTGTESGTSSQEETSNPQNSGETTESNVNSSETEVENTQSDNNGSEEYIPENDSEILDDNESQEEEPYNPDNGGVSTPEQPEDPEEPEDPTYTNFSWMKDVPYGFGAYGLNTTYSPELFMEVATSPEYDYINTFLIEGSNLEQSMFEAKILTENGKNFFLNVHSLLSLGASNVDENLRGDWRSNLKRYAAKLYDIGGDYFQGFYFDEVDLYLNEKDFTRVTKYMREHFGLRTFAVHRRNPFTIPASLGIPIAEYNGKSFVISADNHKYVTDVGWWWYGGYDYYGYNAVSLGDKWKEAMDQLDPNTRKWIVPPIGSFDFRHDEEDCIEVIYAMYREASKVEGFGGLMFYTMGEGGLWGGYGKITVDNEKLTSNDFLKDKDGDFVYEVKRDGDGNIVYEKNEDGTNKLDENGNKIPVMTKILDIKKNNSVTAVRDGMMEYSVEGGGKYWVMTKKEDGTYPWPKARKYFEIIGKGITSGENRESILNKLDRVHKPDYSKYDKNK